MEIFKKLKHRIAGKEEVTRKESTPPLVVCCDQKYTIGCYRASALAFDSSHGLLAAAIAGGVVVYMPNGDTALVSVPHCETASTSLTFVSGAPGRLVIVGSEGKALLVVDLVAQSVLLEHPLPGAAAACLANGPASPYVLCGCSDGAVLVLDAAAPRVCAHELNKGREIAFDSVVANPTDESLVVLCGAQALVQVCGLKDTVLNTYQVDEASHGRVTCVCFSADGKYLFASSDQGLLIVWRARLDRKRVPAPDPPCLSLPLPCAGAPTVALTFAWQQPGYVLYGHVPGFGVFRAELAAERQGLQCTTISCVVATEDWDEPQHMVLMHPPAGIDGPSPFSHVAFLSSQRKVQVASLTDPTSRAYTDVWQGLEEDGVQQCALLSVGDAHATRRASYTCWPGAAPANPPPGARHVLLALGASGRMRAWLYCAPKAELKPATMPLLEGLTADVFRVCHGGDAVLCFARDAAGVSTGPCVVALNMRSGTRAVLWRFPPVRHGPHVAGAYDSPDRASSTDPTAVGSPAQRPAPEAPDDAAGARDSPGRASSTDPTAAGRRQTEASDDGSWELTEGSPVAEPALDEAAVPEEADTGASSAGDRVPEVEEGSDEVAEGDSRRSSPVSQPQGDPPVPPTRCRAMCLAEGAHRLVLVCGDRQLTVVSLADMEAYDIDLMQLLEADVIRQVRAVVSTAREQTIKDTRRQILNAAAQSVVTFVEAASVALREPTTPPSGAAAGESAPKPVLLVATDRGMVYCVVYDAPAEAYIVGSGRVGACAGDDESADHCPALSKVLAVPAATSSSTSQAPACGGPIPANAPQAPAKCVPVNFWLNVFLDPHVLRQAKGRVVGAVRGLFGERLVWFELALQPGRPPALRFGHARPESRFEAQVEVTGLEEEVQALEADEPLVLGISHDSNVGFYIVAVGARTLCTRPYDGPPAASEFWVSSVELAHRPLPEDAAMEEEGVLHLPYLDVSRCVARLELAEQYTQDVALVCEPAGDAAAPGPLGTAEPPEEVCVAGSHRQLAVLALPELQPRASVTTPSDVLDFALVPLDGRWCVVALLRNGTVWVLDALGLCQLSKGLRHPFPSAQEGALTASAARAWAAGQQMGLGVRLTCAAQRGVAGGDSVVVLSSQGYGLRHWRLRGRPAEGGGDLVPELPQRSQIITIPASPAAPAVAPAAKAKRGFFGSMFTSDNGRVAEYHALLSGGPQDAAADPAAMRRELLGKYADTSDKDRTTREADGAAKAAGLQGGLHGAQDVMRQNLQKLEERGERLSELAERSEQLNNAAHDFSSNAKKLRQQMENKKWWQL